MYSEPGESGFLFLGQAYQHGGFLCDKVGFEKVRFEKNNYLKQEIFFREIFFCHLCPAT